MKIIDTLRDRLRLLLTAPHEELGRWARFVRYEMHLWRFCLRRLRQHQAMSMSSALSFRIVFALIPVLVLALLVMKPLGLDEERKRTFRALLNWSGFEQIAQVQQPHTQPGSAPATTPSATMPADGTGGPPEAERSPIPLHRDWSLDTTNVAKQIEALVDRVEKKLTFSALGPVGVVLLIWTALTLLNTVEDSLNRIFGAPRSRSLARRVLLYWSVVTLGPLLLTAAMYVGMQAAKAVGRIPVVGYLVAAVGWAMPLVVGILLLAALYKLMPHTEVRFRAALAGAAVAVPLWSLAKWGFNLYLTHVVASRSLYGALGLLPLFLLWLNLSCAVFLFGAELASTTANLEVMEAAELAKGVVLGPWEQLAVTVAIARPFARGDGAVSTDQIARQVRLPPAAVLELVGRLTAAGICLQAAPASEQSYVLRRPPEDIPVLEAMGITGGQADPAAPGRHGPEMAQVIEAVRDRATEALGTMTLAGVLRGTGGT